MKIHHYPSLPSTQAEAESLWTSGEHRPAMVVADIQTGGKGTQSRYWHSDPGGLYTSTLIPWPKTGPSLTESLQAPGFLPVLHLEVGLILKALIQDLIPSLNPVLKWPNDLNLGPKKCAGILMQALLNTPNKEALILGIGLNVNQPSFPSDLPEATSLRLETQECYNTSHIARQLADRIEHSFCT